MKYHINLTVQQPSAAHGHCLSMPCAVHITEPDSLWYAGCIQLGGFVYEFSAHFLPTRQDGTGITLDAGLYDAIIGRCRELGLINPRGNQYI